MENIKNEKKGQMKEEERITISNMLNEGKYFAEIARTLGRSKTTISDEVQKHCRYEEKGTKGRKFNNCSLRFSCTVSGSCDNVRCNRLTCKGCYTGCGMGKCKMYQEEVCQRLFKPPYVCNGCKKDSSCTLTRVFYRPSVAEKEYRETLSSSREGIVLNEEEVKELESKLKPYIQNKVSISAALMGDKSITTLTPQTIYNYINSGGVFSDIKRIDLKEAVKRKKIRKIKDTSYKTNLDVKIGRKKEDYDLYMETFPDTPVVQMDTVEGKRKEGSMCILTLFLVNCGLQLMFLRERNDSDSITSIFTHLRETLKEEYRKIFQVILTDNGTEFSNPLSLEFDKKGEETGTKVFYCHPLASFEKGKCEKNHHHLREIIPKGTSFKSLTEEKVNLMMNNINSYPRKSLNGKTPFDIFLLLYGEENAKKLGLRKIPLTELVLNPKLL